MNEPRRKGIYKEVEERDAVSEFIFWAHLPELVNKKQMVRII